MQARSQDLQHVGIGSIQANPESCHVENDSGIPSVEDGLKYFMEEHTNDLVLQMELEKLRLQVEETKLKTVQEETQLATVRLEMRKLEVNTYEDGSRKPFWEREIEKFAISRVILGYNPLQRVIWLSILVGFCLMFVYQIMLVFGNYFEYPTKTDVQILDGQVPFPAVTFCNLGGVSFYTAAGWLLEKKKLAEGRNNSNINGTQRGQTDDLEKELNSRKSPRYTLAHELYPLFRDAKVNEYFEKSAIPKEEFFVDLRAKTKNERTNFRMQVDLADLDLKEVDGGEYLKCYTVDVPKQIPEVQTLTLEGSILSGNGMFPNRTDVANKAEYFWWRNRPLRGTVRIFVHQSGARINPRTKVEYIDVLPGQKAGLSFKVKQNIRVGPPYGQCTIRNQFRNDDTIAYSQNECMDMCLNKQVAEQTKSVLMYYPPLDGMTCWKDIEEYNKRPYQFIDELWMMKHAVDLCNYTSKDVDGQSRNLTVLPLYGWPGKFVFDFESCSCHPPCNDIEFDVTTNIQKHELTNFEFTLGYDIDLQGHRVYSNYSGRFRSGTFKVSGEETTAELRGNDDKFHFIEDYIRKDKTSAASDLVSFQISLVGRQVIATVETPLYTPTQLLSEIGGQLELWIGASIITMIEVIELLIAFCCHCCRRRRRRDLNGIV